MPQSEPVSTIETPPTTVWGILGRLGPGLIVAGSIVGSGELIGTTKTGAEAGFDLLWLIMVGCVIKVFVQVEFGRYSLVNGQTTLHGLNAVPGPVIEVRSGRHAGAWRMQASWLVWYWFLMWLAGIGQLGGIVGGVGQAMAIAWPLTEQGRLFNEHVDRQLEVTVREAELRRLSELPPDRRPAPATIVRLQAELSAAQQRRAAQPSEPPPAPLDDRLWATLIAIVTSVCLSLGRYRLIQHFSTLMVCAFTFATLVNLILLQANVSWAVSGREILGGLSLRPLWGGNPAPDGSSGNAVRTALATFGIIGVGASELVTYPYWCLEKGYARFTGPRDDSPQWAERARGWMRVMRWDAWCSMVIYTFATLAFYLLGAAILHRTGLNPAKNTMIRTLAVMYEPVFSEWAAVLFLFGAFAVLYSTYFVANAGNARAFSDSLSVLGLAAAEPAAQRRRVTVLSGVLPLLCLMMYLCFPEPVRLVLVSGLMQSLMLPMLAFAGLHFRYRRSDARIAPGRAWDVLLWVSSLGLLISGAWALWSHLFP